MSVEVAAWLTVAVPAATPVTVIVFAPLQFAGVNSVAPETVALSESSLLGVTVTFAVGFESSTTV